MAAERGSSIGEVVDVALEALEKDDFWRRTREALAKRPVELDSDEAWDRSSADGLASE
jgi:hypothetical protein